MDNQILKDFANALVFEIVQGVNEQMPNVINKAIKENQTDIKIRLKDIYSEPDKPGLLPYSKSTIIKALQKAERLGLITVQKIGKTKSYSKREIEKLNLVELKKSA